MPFWLTLSRLEGEDPLSSFLLFTAFGEGRVGLALLWALVESASILLEGGRVATGIVEESELELELLL